MQMSQMTFGFHAESTALRPQVRDAVLSLAQTGSEESRGAIFTRPEVVEFILDLAGYSAELPLHEMHLLEPSFGGGEFLIAAARRLLSSWRTATPASRTHPGILSHAIRAVELHEGTFMATKAALISTLTQEGLPQDAATNLADAWLVQGDFLLTPQSGTFDFVVGNPPYVRQELIPWPLLAEYRRRYPCMYDRADLYIPFIERSLELLSENGTLGFICSDRWMKNRYGGPLRKLITKHFHLKAYVDMVDTPAFHSKVVAYPAIFVISRHGRSTRIAHRPKIDGMTLKSLARHILAPSVPNGCTHVREMATATNGNEPWLLESPDQMSLIRRLEQDHPCLEEAGCKVGIGVATGADKAFIGMFDDLDVEPDRKLPLATTRDIARGDIHWLGLGVINPFDDDGNLVNLADYPRLRRYLDARKEIIAQRHCAKKSPTGWYRTIDRITPSLAKCPKLLIPDIKGEANVVFEDGRLYPHHNLYYVISGTWSLRALQAVLLSSLSRLFITVYSTHMRGGFLRFQAQYLRRIRIPQWETVPLDLREELATAAMRRDISACNRATFRLYGLTGEEKSAIGGNGEKNHAA